MRFHFALDRGVTALGASWSPVRKMRGVEFLLIGALATIVGIILSIAL